MSADLLVNRPVGVVGTSVVEAPAVAVDVTAPLRDRVRWGPVVAGVLTGVTALLVLTALGLALGISTLGGESAATWGTAAGIWGGLSLLVAFFLGGWVAGHTATTLREGDGPLNGFLTGAATLILLLWLATTALTGALGFFASTVTGLAGAAAPAAIQAVNTGVVPEQNVQEAATAVAGAAENPQAAVPAQTHQAAQQAAQTARQAAGPGAWGTLIAMVLALIAASLGGMIGHSRAVPRTHLTVR
jgi:hypothetical protein